MLHHPSLVRGNHDGKVFFQIINQDRLPSFYLHLPHAPLSNTVYGHLGQVSLFSYPIGDHQLRLAPVSRNDVKVAEAHLQEDRRTPQSLLRLHMGDSAQGRLCD
jgi:hypothetical protein